VDDGFVRIASLAEVPEGELRAFETAVGRIAVVHVEQEWFGLADECPGDGAPLSEGALGDGEDTVICPADGAEFDLRTGEPIAGPAVDAVPRYAVRLDDEGWVEVGRPLEGGS
jgi:nitrite reductase/ring-hydroxylating ferredoxin subunit